MWCWGLKVCVPRSNPYIGTLTPKDDGIKGGAFERCLSDEDGALTNGIGALIRQAPESSLAPPTSRTQRKDSSLGPGRGSRVAP